MSDRPAALRTFLERLRDALAARTADDDAARVTTARVFDALERPNPSAGTGAGPGPARLPVCRHLEAALATAASASADLRAVAEAFAAVEPALRWQRRAGSEAVGEPFHGAHANATLIGPDGLETRRDVWIGCSLLGPHVRYPDHRHPPEEIYLVLSTGEWLRQGEPWREPGTGGIVHNPPDVVHAMRSGAEPLFAIWCLPLGAG